MGSAVSTRALDHDWQPIRISLSPREMFEGASEKQRAIRIVDRMSAIVKRSDTGAVSLI